MTCAAFDRWLDDGMPEGIAAACHAHARVCARCAAALEGARAVEAALSEAAPAETPAPARAPASFSSGVMARVRTAEVLRVRDADRASEERWWIRLLSDPVSSVSLTVAFFAAGLLIWNPAWVFRLGGWLGAHWFTWIARAGEVPVDPRVLQALVATASPFVLWGLWQIGRNLERAIILSVTRPVR
jgi:hypothetical protein